MYTIGWAGGVMSYLMMECGNFYVGGITDGVILSVEGWHDVLG